MELFFLHQSTGYKNKGIFLISLLIFTALSYGLFTFSLLNKNLILFSFLTLSIFDSFSQITGQLWGRQKIVPKISPHKTWGGFIGGTLVALFSAILLHKLFSGTLTELLIIATGIIVFAFAGDLAASWYKRIFQAKDFSNLIPGHGGLLDRFDSLLAGGAWVALSAWFLNI
jgi:phosphatidate cytidylyltransferase